MAFAVSSLHEYWLDICCGNKDKLDLDLSEEFLFYGCKARDGLKGSGGGTTLVAASQSLELDGQCLEALHPYQRKSSLLSVPSKAAFADGKGRVLKTLVRLKADLAAVRESLVNNVPVVAAIELFKNAYQAGPAGLLRMPANSERPVGRHAVLIVEVEGTGSEEHLIFLNSWGQKWGNAGLGKFSTQYFSAHCKQVWSIELTKESQ